jgi:hypothetical protein
LGFKANIAASVISTLIAALIIKLFGLWPMVWSWLNVTTATAWSVASSVVPVPVGVLALLSIMFIYFFASALLSARVSSTMLEQAEQELEVLSENELKVVRLLAAADGKWALLSNIASDIRLSRLVTEQALDKLFARDFLLDSHNYMHGTSYRLSSTGRDYAIEKGFVRG